MSVATVIVGLSVATVVITVDVLAVLVDVIAGKGKVWEQYVSAGPYLLSVKAMTLGITALQ